MGSPSNEGVLRGYLVSMPPPCPPPFLSPHALWGGGGGRKEASLNLRCPTPQGRPWSKRGPRREGGEERRVSQVTTAWCGGCRCRGTPPGGRGSRRGPSAEHTADSETIGDECGQTRNIVCANIVAMSHDHFGVTGPPFVPQGRGGSTFGQSQRLLVGQDGLPLPP